MKRLLTKNELEYLQHANRQCFENKEYGNELRVREYLVKRGFLKQISGIPEITELGKSYLHFHDAQAFRDCQKLEKPNEED